MTTSHNQYVIRTRPGGGKSLETYHSDPDCHALRDSGTRPIGPDDPRFDDLELCKLCTGERDNSNMRHESEALRALKAAAEGT